MNDQFKRILDLVRRTGDTMIVTDSDGDQAYVVMDLDAYEVMIDMQQDSGSIGWPDETSTVSDSEIPDLLDETEDSGPNIWDVMQTAGQSTETWDPAQMDPEQLAELEQQYQDFAARNVHEAIPETGNGSESSKNTEVPEKEIEKSKEDDDFGEEQFYLEPVE